MTQEVNELVQLKAEMLDLIRVNQQLDVHAKELSGALQAIAQAVNVEPAEGQQVVSLKDIVDAVFALLPAGEQVDTTE